MAFKTMYPPQKDSPSTFLLGDISAVDTLMTVASAAALPQTLPYPLTLGIDKTLTETVMVTAQNLENNQLTITRGTPAYAWLSGSKAARVLRATDFLDVQDNLRDVDTRLTTTQGTVSTHGTDISTLKTTVGGPTSGLVKGLADEITRATGAENAEVTRATNAETNLNTIKVNRSELAQVITDWVYSADETKVLVTITRYNASTQQTTKYTRTLPVASDEAMGVMTPEAYAEITALRNDVNSLINLGGRFIGVSFATKAALDAYVVPASIKTGDFTYVIDDETKSGATTRYVWNGSTWEFTFVIEHDPVGLATSSTPGLVKSDSGSTDGKVFVEIDGTMSVIGWNSVFNADNHVSGTTNKVFTATEQTKLDGIAAGAEKNVNADFNATSGDAQILNLPSTFPPSVHGHDIADVNDLSASLSNNAADHPHRNLLDNWDFRNPVNQRGLSSYSVYNGYAIDRWRLEFSQTGCQVQIVSGGVKFVTAAGGWILLGQLIEGINKVNGAVTLSAVIDGTLYSVTTTLVAGSNTAFNQDAITDWNFSINNSENGRTGLLYGGTGTPVVSAIKLELGAVSTLANDPPADYGEQLSLCQRYARWMAGCYSGYIDNVNNIQLSVPEIKDMRTLPTISNIQWDRYVAIPYGDGGVFNVSSDYETAITYNGLHIGNTGLNISRYLPVATVFDFRAFLSADL